MHREILITAHPRSGTGYMAQLLQLYGFDVQHEAVGADGISSWGFAVRHLPFAHFDNKHRGQFTFTHHIQTVRDPIEAIASIAYTEQKSEAWRSKFVVLFGNPVQRATMSYMGWNKLIYAQNPTLITKLETAHKNIATYFDLPEQKLTQKVNTREHPKLTKLGVLNALDPDLQPVFEKFYNWYLSLP